jgi:hypothetical protein
MPTTDETPIGIARSRSPKSQPPGMSIRWCSKRFALA